MKSFPMASSRTPRRDGRSCCLILPATAAEDRTQSPDSPPSARELRMPRHRIQHSTASRRPAVPSSPTALAPTVRAAAACQRHSRHAAMHACDSNFPGEVTCGRREIQKHNRNHIMENMSRNRAPLLFLLKPVSNAGPLIVTASLPIICNNN